MMHGKTRNAVGWLIVLLLPVGCQNPGSGEVETGEASPLETMLARAESLELDTDYVPPPGDALDHHTSGFAKILCSAVFITGLDPDFAAENVGYFSSPYEERSKVSERVVDRENKAVHLTLPNGVTRTAKFLGDQGCVTLPIGEDWGPLRPRRSRKQTPGPGDPTLAHGRCSIRRSHACGT